jgi:hypothetical protein
MLGPHLMLPCMLCWPHLYTDPLIVSERLARSRPATALMLEPQTFSCIYKPLAFRDAQHARHLQAAGGAGCSQSCRHQWLKGLVAGLQTGTADALSPSLSRCCCSLTTPYRIPRRVYRGSGLLHPILCSPKVSPYTYQLQAQPQAAVSWCCTLGTRPLHTGGSLSTQLNAKYCAHCSC